MVKELCIFRGIQRAMYFLGEKELCISCGKRPMYFLGGKMVYILYGKRAIYFSWIFHGYVFVEEICLRKNLWKIITN